MICEITLMCERVYSFHLFSRAEYSVFECSFQNIQYKKTKTKNMHCCTYKKDTNVENEADRQTESLENSNLDFNNLTNVMTMYFHDCDCLSVCLSDCIIN